MALITPRKLLFEAIGKLLVLKLQIFFSRSKLQWRRTACSFFERKLDFADVSLNSLKKEDGELYFFFIFSSCFLFLPVSIALVLSARVSACHCSAMSAWRPYSISIDTHTHALKISSQPVAHSGQMSLMLTCLDVSVGHATASLATSWIMALGHVGLVTLSCLLGFVSSAISPAPEVVQGLTSCLK